MSSPFPGMDWPIALDSPLPSVPVPLLSGDDDVSLNLQQAFNTIYNLLGYDLAVDYGQPPSVPLRGDDVRWAEHMIASWRKEHPK